jgi:hypothetical protein
MKAIQQGLWPIIEKLQDGLSVQYNIKPCTNINIVLGRMTIKLGNPLPLQYIGIIHKVFSKRKFLQSQYKLHSRIQKSFVVVWKQD